MHFWNTSDLLPLASDTGQLLLLTILFYRRLYRVFPVFSAFILWELASDLLVYLFLAIQARHNYLSAHYVQVYYSLNIINYLFELAVLLEIASNVLHPSKKAVSRRVLYIVSAVVLTTGVMCFVVAAQVTAQPFSSVRVLLVINTTAAILCVAMFVLIGGFSQLLGLSWKNHVLQLTTGLAFYSIIELAVELMQSELRASPFYVSRYQMWSEFGAIGYLCTLSFWCYAFLKKEVPRKEFSPQMAQILVSLSGGAKRQHAVLARSRDD